MNNELPGWIASILAVVFYVSTIGLFIYGVRFYPDSNAWVITRLFWGVVWALIPLAGLVALLAGFYVATLAFGVAGLFLFVRVLFTETW